MATKSKFKVQDIIYSVIGLLVLFEVIKVVFPLIIGTDFTNASIWGSFGSAILPTLVPLLLAVAILMIVLVKIGALHGGGAHKYGM